MGFEAGSIAPPAPPPPPPAAGTDGFKFIFFRKRDLVLGPGALRLLGGPRAQH